MTIMWNRGVKNMKYFSHPCLRQNRGRAAAVR